MCLCYNLLFIHYSYIGSDEIFKYHTSFLLQYNNKQLSTLCIIEDDLKLFYTVLVLINYTLKSNYKVVNNKILEIHKFN